eukprot:2884610-Rhodomonas_salina.4
MANFATLSSQILETVDRINAFGKGLEETVKMLVGQVTYPMVLHSSYARPGQAGTPGESAVYAPRRSAIAMPVLTHRYGATSCGWREAVPSESPISLRNVRY